jgi:hypothetical protein
MTKRKSEPVAHLGELRAQQSKRARAQREDRELYARYRDDPERQKIAPPLAQLSREDGVLEQATLRAKRTLPKKKTPPNLQAAHDRFLATVRRYVDDGSISGDVYEYMVSVYAPKTNKPAAKKRR